MKRFKKILVATDTRLDDHPIVSEAAEIARKNGAILKIIDVVPEFSWPVRLTLENHEHLRDLVREEKEEVLDRLAEPIRESGLGVETEVFLGQTSLEIIGEVERGHFDLVLRVAKGPESRRSGFFGTTGIRLLRKCPCAVWLVTPNTTPRFKHVLGCVDTSSEEPLDAELNDKVYELARSVSQYHGGRFSIIHAWSIYGEQIFRGRLKEEEYEELEKNTEHHVEEQFNAFLKNHGSQVRESNVSLIRGEPQIVIPQFVRENAVDLVVMGTVARSGLAGMMMGNTSEMILNSLECSVLALKPESF